MAGELAGQVAIVTGGGRGIGRAIARAVAAAGAAVTVTARSEDQLRETVALIEAQDGRALALTADVTDRMAVEQMMAETERRLGPVDLLVNNAGIWGAIGPTWEVDPEDWWRGVAVLLRGPFLCARTVLPGMVARHRGRIINVASSAAWRTNPSLTALGSAKAGLVRFTDSLAAELQPHGVSVFAINPGGVRTAMTEELMTTEAGRRAYPGLDSLPAEFWSPPERAGELCVALASGRADGLSGRFLDVNDDIAALAERVEQIQQDDLYALRRRT